MNAAEAITLCRFVKGACPQQAIDEYTPDAWLVLLGPYRFEDCRQAAIDLARQSPFVAPAEIITRVKQIRGKRIAEYGPMDPPPEVQRGEVPWRDWFIATRTAIADGELLPTRRPIDAATRARLDRHIEGTFRTVDEEFTAATDPEADALRDTGVTFGWDVPPEPETPAERVQGEAGEGAK